MNKLLLAIILLTNSNLFSQTHEENTPHCGHTFKMKELYKINPELQKKVESAQLEATLRCQQKSVTDDTIIYVIPIVFHVLHQNGSENISDAQVKDAVDVLNRDYRLKNEDTSLIVPSFSSIKGDARIEFRLATKDPWGNCTNGIEHIYSHETNFGNDDSKLNQWDRSRYLNIWVVDYISADGGSLAGYSYYPSAADGMFNADGVIILNNYVGRIGTSGEYSSRTLTHEIGHWLNLSHTWGSTNDPEVNCGDDGVEDTPETKGHYSCDLTDDFCNEGTVENVQNYMEYSYCSYMFTQDQVKRMRDALVSVAANRDNLITDATHLSTGIDLTTPPVCAPVAAFKSDKKLICQGSSVQFTDISWQAPVNVRTWTFEGGTPATSSNPQVSVTFDSPGFKKVTLYVENENGSDEIQEINYIYVSPTWPDFTGPNTDNFESSQSYFIVENPENNWAHFHKINGVGINNSTCYKLNNFKNISNAMAYSEDWYYYRRLGGNRDALISNSYDLSNTSDVEVSFKYAYATNAAQFDDIEETLKIYSSRDCGATWTLRKTLTVQELVTAGFAGGQEFIPNENEWGSYSFSYTPNTSDEQTRFKIEFTASDFSNNLYIDNFEISGTLGLLTQQINDLNLKVYPNPKGENEEIHVSFNSVNNPVHFTLKSINGQIIHEETIQTDNGAVQQILKINQKLEPACYLLEIQSGEMKFTKKIIVL